MPKGWCKAGLKPYYGFRVYRGSVFRVEGRGFKVQSSGLSAEGKEGFKSLGFKVHD